MWIFVAYLFLGAVAGVLAGLLGVGGGIVVVPAFFFLFQAQAFPQGLLMHLAVGSSLATVVFTSLTSAYAHHRRGAVLWPNVRRLIPGIVAGALLGAAVADHVPSKTLRMLFGLFECFVAIQLALGFKPAPHRELPGRAGMTFMGLAVGSVSTMLGIGGGTITVPFLLWCNTPIRQAVATSAACGLPIAMTGAVGFLWAGLNTPSLPESSTGFLYWPAILGVAAGSVCFTPLGAWLAHTLPVDVLRRLFAVVLAVIGVRMLV
jgi:uncharacterized membrane protein YfcA